MISTQPPTEKRMKQEICTSNFIKLAILNHMLRNKNFHSTYITYSVNFLESSHPEYNLNLVHGSRYGKTHLRIQQVSLGHCFWQSPYEAATAFFTNKNKQTNKKSQPNTIYNA